MPGQRPRLPIRIKKTNSPRRILNLVFFLCVLFTILYLNHSSSNTEPFAWRTIEYRTTSSTLPPARGTCPDLASTTKPALIIARMTSDTDSWLTHPSLTSKYHLCVYTADAPHDHTSSTLQLPVNRGHEAMAYLTFIIDNYSSLPEAMVFIHGSRFAWHNDHPTYDNLALLSTLNISAALVPHGYHNLKCDWAASTCPKGTEAQGSLQMSVRKVIEGFNLNVLSDAALPGALEAIFGVHDGGRVRLGRNDAVKAQCCAQFVVRRQNVLQHGREEYVALRQWLLDGMVVSGVREAMKRKGASHPDDRVAGRVVSYIWHILFMPHETKGIDGKEEGIDLVKLNKIACPSAEECYCRLYGRCDLQGCNEDGSCNGQYSVPRGFRLPEGWAERYESIRE